MKLNEPLKIAASQLVTAKDLQAMINYLKNFELKYRSNKNSMVNKKKIFIKP